jgi:hypothetical protein
VGDSADQVPDIPLPRPLRRRMRLGPFASYQDVVKFVVIAGAGALVAAATTPAAWLVFLVGGFALIVPRFDGRSANEQLTMYVRWRIRRRSGTRRGAPLTPRGAFVHVDSGQWVAGVRAGGVPTSFLPPRELRQMFRRWREFLRTLNRPTRICIGGRRLEPEKFRPRPSDSRHSSRERVAHESYGEFVDLLTRQRFRRCVDVILFDQGERGSRIDGLSSATEELVAAVEGLGVEARRLRDRELVRAWEHVRGEATP